MRESYHDLGKEAVYWLAETLSGGWVRPALLEQIFRAFTRALSPVKYLTLSPEDLKRRYYEETLVSVPVGQEWFELPQAWVFDNTGRRLPLGCFELIIDEISPEYEIPVQIESKASALLEKQKRLQKRQLYDSTTIRLNGIKESDGRIHLLVAKTHYFDYLATNFSIDAQLKGWSESLRDTVHPRPRLCRLEESLLANHMGIGVLVFTADGFLVLPVRSRAGVNIRRREIGPSISGATNYDRDIINSLSKLVYPCFREGAEELGIEASNFSISDTVLLAITRELLRGGKPELFFSTTLNIAASDLRRRFRKAEHRYETSRIRLFEFRTALHEAPIEEEKPGYYWSLLSEFTQCLELYGKQMSLPALTNLVLWLKRKLTAA
jgi:hypothetical protein